MTPKFTWRASDELTAAIREYHKARKEFIATAVHEFNAEHPDHGARWYRHSFTLDPVFRGFADGTTDVPEGLSRAQKRDYLIPARGPKSKPWRESVAAMGKIPTLDVVFREHNLASNVWSGQHVYQPGMFDDGEHVFIACGGDITTERPADGTSKHVTPVKLSEFYAAKEAHEAKAAPATDGGGDS
jgi:hypothetical protein